MTLTDSKLYSRPVAKRVVIVSTNFLSVPFLAFGLPDSKEDLQQGANP